MAVVPVPHRGWNLREAVVRTVDPDLLQQCIAVARAWRDAGSPPRIAWLGTSLNGNDAARSNANLRDQKRIFDAEDEVARKTRQGLGKHLRSGRLVACGRRESPTADSKPIPATAWDALVIKNYRPLILREATPAKTKIFDVRIYPAVEAPNAIECLMDMSIAEAFQNHVFGDPQVATLCKHAKAKGCEPLEPGFLRGLYSALWPVDCGKADTWDRQLKFIEPSRRTGSDRPAHMSNLVLGRRFARLISYLASDQLIAEGIDRTGRAGVLLPKSLWAHDRMYIDVNNGDLLEFLPDADGDPYSVMFTALVLRKPGSAFHMKPIPYDADAPGTTELQRAPKRSLVTAGDRSAARKACTNWLEEMMRASPDERTASKTALWQKAQGKWRGGRLSERAFLAAWDDAIRRSDATAWTLPGAPKKQKNRGKPRNQRTD